MNEALIGKAKAILKNLKEHRFLKKELFKNVTEQLTSIEEELSQRQYKTMNAFISQTKDALMHPFIEGGEFQSCSYLHKYILDLFEKELKRASLYSPTEWASLVVKYHTKYSELLSKSPGGFIPNEFSQKIMRKSKNDEVNNHLTMDLLQQFSEDSKIFNHDENARNEAIKILREKEPTIDVDKNDIEIDVTKLDELTISLLNGLIHKD